MQKHPPITQVSAIKSIVVVFFSPLSFASNTREGKKRKSVFFYYSSLSSPSPPSFSRHKKKEDKKQKNVRKEAVSPGSTPSPPLKLSRFLSFFSLLSESQDLKKREGERGREMLRGRGGGFGREFRFVIP